MEGSSKLCNRVRIPRWWLSLLNVYFIVVIENMDEVIRLMLQYLFYSVKTNMVNNQTLGYQTEVTSLSKILFVLKTTTIN
jgi:hypothetical protein